MIPLISVIIPCYKYGRFLRECVESVQKQTHNEVEIMVVCDGSEDETLEVVTDMDVPCLVEKNKGLAASRNYGIRFTHGDYIMCLDADDVLPPDSLEKHLALIQNSPDRAVIAQLGLQMFGERHDQCYPNPDVNREALRHRNYVYCNALFPRYAWELVKYDESPEMRNGWEDYLFWYEIAKLGFRFVTSPDVGLLYRQHPNSMTVRTTHPRVGIIKAYMKKKHPEMFP